MHLRGQLRPKTLKNYGRALTKVAQVADLGNVTETEATVTLLPDGYPSLFSSIHLCLAYLLPTEIKDSSRNLKEFCAAVQPEPHAENYGWKNRLF